MTAPRSGPRKSRSGPTIPSAQRKRPIFSTTLDPATIATIRESAEVGGVTISEWVTRAVEAYAARSPQRR